MRRTIIRVSLIVGAVLVLALLSAGLALATGDHTNMPCVSDYWGWGRCTHVYLTGPSMIGDYYVDGSLEEAGVHEALWGFFGYSDGERVTFEFRNIQEPGNPEFGVWYIYKDVSKSVALPPVGLWLDVEMTPTKQYIAGPLEVTCDIQNYAGEDVRCSVAIDGNVMPELAAGQVGTLLVAPGSHTVATTLVGNQANLWAPSSTTQSVTVTASATPKKVKATFKKAGHLIINLDQAGVVGDFYVDGTLIATQAASIDLYVEHTKSHKVEVKNLTDPAAAGIYTWKDATKTVTVKTGETKTVTIALTKQYLKGFLELTCDIKNYAGEAVQCGVTIDGVPQAEVAAGTVTTYTLDPGDHTVLVELKGDQALLWSPASLTKTVNIKAKATPTKYSATFKKAGHLIVNLDQAGVVGDFYVDGTLVATQAASIDLFVEHTKSHKVEVKNLTDPAAAGIYMWKDASASATVPSGQTKTVTIKLTKQYLKGFLELTCNIKNYAGEDVNCGVTIDGVSQGIVLAGSVTTYTLDPGDHTVDVILGGTQANMWSPATLNKTVKITAKATPTKYSATFEKNGHLIVNLSQPGVVADFYVDGVLVGQGVASIDLWVKSKVQHKIEVKNIVDPTGALWKEATKTVTLNSGEEKTVTITLEPQ